MIRERDPKLKLKTLKNNIYMIYLQASPPNTKWKCSHSLICLSRYNQEEASPLFFCNGINESSLIFFFFTRAFSVYYYPCLQSSLRQYGYGYEFRYTCIIVLHSYWPLQHLLLVLQIFKSRGNFFFTLNNSNQPPSLFPMPLTLFSHNGNIIVLCI